MRFRQVKDGMHLESYPCPEMTDEIVPNNP